MRTPRINSAQDGVGLQQLASRRLFRYGVSVAAVAAACAATTFEAADLGQPVYRLMLFLAILAAAVIGGLGPGLLATAIATLAGHFAPGGFLDLANGAVLASEGLLVSIAGGILRTARAQSNERLAANLRLEQQILEISDDERRSIGHNLHDGLGQHLTGISLLTETISQQIESGGKPDPASVETITQLVSEAVKITRDLAKSLSPIRLERDGLIAALEELADTSSSLFAINCQCNLADRELDLDRTRSLHLYRIAQEAVNNSVRHGKARTVQIDLSINGKDLTMIINDDGSGLSEKTSQNPGLGLRIMEYRARMLGASLTVERASAAGGTVVTCTCPVEK